MHRAELARQLQTSRATITNTVTTLLEQGLVEPAGLTAGATAGDGKAPLKEKLVLARRAGIIGAVIHQDDATLVGLGELDGRVISTRNLPCSPDATGAERTSTALTALRELLDELPAPRPQLHGLHVAPNTLMDRYTGEVLGGAASSRWAGENIRDEHEKGLSTAVVLENIARHAAYAQYGALEDPLPRNLLHVSLSFGIALGQVLDGRIISGAHGGAGELGHVKNTPKLLRERIPCISGQAFPRSRTEKEPRHHRGTLPVTPQPFSGNSESEYQRAFRAVFSP